MIRISNYSRTMVESFESELSNVVLLKQFQKPGGLSHTSPRTSLIKSLEGI